MTARPTTKKRTGLAARAPLWLLALLSGAGLLYGLLLVGRDEPDEPSIAESGPTPAAAPPTSPAAPSPRVVTTPPQPGTTTLTNTAAPPATPETAADYLAAAQAALPHDPQETLRLLYKADENFGPLNADRRAVEIEAYVALGRIGHARSLAHRFYGQFPLSQHVDALARLTGYHPRPRGGPRLPQPE